MAHETWMSRRAVIHAVICFGKKRQRCRAMAVTVREALVGWRLCGQLVKRLQVLSRNIRIIQVWWRSRSVSLRAITLQVSKEWLQIEKPLALKEAKEKRKDVAKRAAKSAKEGEPWLSNEKERLCFLEHELRARRYALMPRLAFWQQDMDRWRQDMAIWRLTNSKDRPLFRWPSLKPLYMPTAAEMAEMVKRARQLGADAWTKIMSPKERIVPVKAVPQYIFVDEEAQDARLR